MTETKKLSRKTRKMLALFEAEVGMARDRVIDAAKLFENGSSGQDVILATVADLRKAEALLAAAVEVAHA